MTNKNMTDDPWEWMEYCQGRSIGRKTKEVVKLVSRTFDKFALKPVVSIDGVTRKVTTMKYKDIPFLIALQHAKGIFCAIHSVMEVQEVSVCFDPKAHMTVAERKTGWCIRGITKYP